MKDEMNQSDRGAEVPFSPDFTRLPIRPPEEAVYRKDEPPRGANNPLYLAIPGPRSMLEVRKLIEGDNPTFDPAIRDLPAHLRRERIDDVDTVLFALRRHIELEDMVMTTIRNAFVAAPWSERFLADAAARAHNLGTANPTTFNAGASSVGSGSVAGGVGEGKTVSLKKILMGCPQTIRHGKFKGRTLGFTQISWLYLSMPPKASAAGLLRWIASVMDRILGTNYRGELEKEKNHADRTRLVASKLAIHAVGVIFCDELQNIKVGSVTERGLLENTLQELINYTHTRWVFIGTKVSRGAVRSEALLRRMVGERGQINWNTLPLGSEWAEFLKKLWGWQVTRKPTPLTPEITLTMHRLTCGVPDYAKKLFTTAQANIVGNSRFPEEQLTPEVLTATMKRSFGELHLRLEERYRIHQAKLARTSRQAKEEAKDKAVTKE